MHREHMHKGLMGQPTPREQEAALSRYISEQTAKIRASWSEITHRVRQPMVGMDEFYSDENN